LAACQFGEVKSSAENNTKAKTSVKESESSLQARDANNKKGLLQVCQPEKEGQRKCAPADEQDWQTMNNRQPEG